MIRRIIPLLLCLFSLIPSSVGFAAWLKCNRGLEEDEIIMNNKVKKAPSEEPIKLAVFDDSGSRVDVPSEEHGGDSIVWIDPSDSTRSLSFSIGMDPETVAGMADIQFVVETFPFEDLKASNAPSRSTSPSPMTPTAPSRPSPNKLLETSFVDASKGGGVLCNGRRGHARGKKGLMKYKLVTKANDDSTLAEVVAGYSEYHGAVTLTPRILFKRKEEQHETSSAATSESTAGDGEL